MIRRGTNILWGLAALFAMAEARADTTAPRRHDSPSSQGAAVPESGTPPAVSPGATAARPAAAGDLAYLLGVVATVNDAEVKAGELAQQKSTSEPTRAYGKTLADQHRLSDRSLYELVKAVKVGRAAESGNPGVQQLKLNLEGDLQQLQAASPADFDALFATIMVKRHQEALKAATQGKADFKQKKKQVFFTEINPYHLKTKKTFLTLKNQETLSNNKSTLV